MSFKKNRVTFKMVSDKLKQGKYSVYDCPSLSLGVPVVCYHSSYFLIQTLPWGNSVSTVVS